MYNRRRRRVNPKRRYKRYRNTFRRSNIRGNSLKMRNTSYKDGYIIAPIYATPLKYASNGISLSGAPLGYSIMRGNGPRDPDYAIGGGTPLGYDELMRLYGSYRCYASKVKVRVTPKDSTVGVQNIVCSVFPSTDAVTMSNVDAIQEQPYSKTIYRNLYSGNPVLSSYMATNRIYGVTKRAVSIEDYYAGDNSMDPVKEWYWHIYVYSQDNLSDINCYLNVEVVYYLEFFERNKLDS